MNGIKQEQRHHTLFPVPFTAVTIEDHFWAPRQKAHKEITLKICLDKCETTGRITNFARTAGLMEGTFEGRFYNDSDVYKVLEGVAYSLMNHPDPELEERADQIIDVIAAAQQENGYLFCYYTLVDPDKKWTDMWKHEMYCGGHLIEAAVAYKQATGKRKLFDAACKLADHYDIVFGPGKRHWVPGHEEIELALVKLYRETHEERYLKLANWLLEERGHGHGVGESWDREGWGTAYCQDDTPVRDLSKARGHAVRAMYLYTGMTDVAAITGDQEYLNALDRLWDNIVLRNMYLTGGIGPSKHNEGFTEDYDLPNASAYAETCASVGMVFWNHRMNLLHGESKYADIVERAMYNGALAGVSSQGDHFFYVNPLASDGTHHRQEWYECSCCPTQIARFIPSIGNYVYVTSEDGIGVNLYISGTGTIPIQQGQVRLTQTTHYPWNGRIEITLNAIENSDFTIYLRFPGWCRSASVNINDRPLDTLHIKKGYIILRRKWETGDTIMLDLAMPVERVYAHPKIQADVGRVAIQRGPLVYCVEEVDNGEIDFTDLTLSPDAKFLVEFKPDVLGGVAVITAVGPDHEERLTFVPYFAWDNREPGWMEVWLPEKQVKVKAHLYRF